MKENMIKRNPLIPLMNEGLGELKCRRHFVLFFGKSFMCSPPFYDLITIYTYVYVKRNMYIYKFLHLRIFAGAFIMP